MYLQCYVFSKNEKKYQHFSRELDGVVVEHQTPSPEVLGSISTCVSILCPEQDTLTPYSTG